jgi:hypothetical protein
MTSNFDNNRNSSKKNYKAFETATHAFTSVATAPSTSEAASTSTVTTSARKEASAITRDTAITSTIEVAATTITAAAATTITEAMNTSRWNNSNRTAAKSKEAVYRSCFYYESKGFNATTEVA